MSAFIHHNYSMTLYFARQPEKAIEHARRAIELEPQYAIPHFFLAASLAQLGRHDEALRTMETFYLRVGRRADADRILNQLLKTGADPISTAQMYFELGNLELGFEQLTKAFDLRLGPLRHANVSPAYDAVRADPRFKALVARLKM
jgi:tetratricopeptide (TPR) repeat protein